MNEKEQKNKLIKIKNLSVTFIRNYKVFRALNNINLDVYQNEILGIVGESGSGKTTIGRSILGLVDHTKGTIEIDNNLVSSKKIKSISKNNIWIYKYGQMIFQDPTSSLNRLKKVNDLILEGFRNFKSLKKEINQKIKQIEEKIELYNQYIKFYEDNNFYNKYLIQESLNERIENFLNVLIETNDEISTNISAKKLYDECIEKKHNYQNEFKKLKQQLNQEITFIKKEIKSDKIVIKNDEKHNYQIIKKNLKDQKEELELFKSYSQEKLKEHATLNREYIYKEIIDKIEWNLEKYPILNKIEYFDFNNFEEVKKTKSFISNLFQKIEEQTHLHYLIKNFLLDFDFLLKTFESNDKVINTFSYTMTYLRISQKLINYINYEQGIVDDLYLKLSYFDSNYKIEENSKEGIVYKDFLINYLNKYLSYSIEKIDFFKNILFEFKQKAINLEDFYNHVLDFTKKNKDIFLSFSTWKWNQKIKLVNLKYKYDYFLIKNNQLFIDSIIQRLFENDYHINDYDNWYKNFVYGEHIFKNEFNFVTQIKSNWVEKEFYFELSKEELILELEKLNIESNKLKQILKSKKLQKEFENEKVKEILKLVDLPIESINKYPDEFSGGQKQRIGIARALISSPKFIIADEPISALDVSVQAQIINLLKEIKKTVNLTILFIAHDLQIVNYISDRIIVIYHGNIVEYGDSNEIYNNPIHPYTKSLIEAMPSLSKIGQKLKTSNYNWDKHNYNDFTNLDFYRVDNKDHYVYGKKDEVERWMK